MYSLAWDVQYMPFDVALSAVVIESNAGLRPW